MQGETKEMQSVFKHTYSTEITYHFDNVDNPYTSRFVEGFT